MDLRKTFITLMVTALMVFLVAGFASASGIELTDGVETGMKKYEVEEEINLEHTLTDEGLTGCQRYEVKDGEKQYYASYYFFNADTNELIYKLLPSQEGDKHEKADELGEDATSVVRERGTYFIAREGSDLGFKLMDAEDEGEYQLWIGSISLWDEVAEDNSSLNPFEFE